MLVRLHSLKRQTLCCTCFSQRESGIALVSMLLLFVMVVTLSVGMIKRQELTLKRANNTLQRADLREVALGIELNIREMIFSLLERAKLLGRSKELYLYFNPLGFFAAPLQIANEYDVSIHISDPQGKLNLNELAQNDANRRQAAERVLRKLLSDLNFEDPNGMVEEVKRWLDADLNVSDAEYEARAIPHKAGHQPFKHFSELEIFEWLTEKDRQLQKLNWLNVYVDVYPVDEGAKVNLNTACKKLLDSLFSDCTKCVGELLKQRDSGVQEVPTEFMRGGFKEINAVHELASFAKYYANDSSTDNNRGNGNVATGSGAASTNRKWAEKDLDIMTRYLDVYIRVQRKGTDNVFDMTSRFLVDADKPSVVISLRNFSPIQPITLANQRVCIE